MQLVLVHCSIARSVLEYACPVWAALPKYFDDAIESVKKRRALRIVLLNCHYDDALIQSWHHSPFPEKGGSLHKFYQAWPLLVFCTQAIRDFKIVHDGRLVWLDECHVTQNPRDIDRRASRTVCFRRVSGRGIYGENGKDSPILIRTILGFSFIRHWKLIIQWVK